MLSRHPPASGALSIREESPRSGSDRTHGAGHSQAPRWFLWLAALALAGYAIFLAVNSAVVAAGADSSGYFNSARLLAAGELRTGLRIPAEWSAATVNPSQFVPLGFKLSPDHSDVVPSYPTGLPLHFAAASTFVGWKAGPLLVQVLAATGAVSLCYLTARRLGLGFALAGAGAAILAAFPVFIFTSIQTLSDTLSTTWALAAFYCGLRARDNHRWAAACGAAYALSVLVRPTNLLFAPIFIVLLGISPRRLVFFVIGGLPAAVWLALYNHHLYGSALSSGYGNSFEAFGWQYGWITAVHFTKWLALMLPAVVLILPLAALARGDTRRREYIALALMIASNIGLYLFYDVSHDVWWCLRFILPAVAALILAAMLGTEAVARGPGARWPRAFRPIAALGLTTWAAALSWYWVRHLHVLYVPGYERFYDEMGQVARERIPGNAIVVCSAYSGALYYHTELPALIYETVKPGEFAGYVTLARQSGRPFYAVIFNIEEEEALRTRCPGAWTRIAAVDNIGIWRLE